MSLRDLSELCAGSTHWELARVEAELESMKTARNSTDNELTQPCYARWGTCRWQSQVVVSPNKPVVQSWDRWWRSAH